jgi:hypothetical protein
VTRVTKSTKSTQNGTTGGTNTDYCNPPREIFRDVIKLVLYRAGATKYTDTQSKNTTLTMTTTAAVLTRMSHRRQPLLVVLILLSSVVQCVRSNSYDRPVAAEKKLVPSESSPQSLSASLARLPPRHPKRLSKRGRFSIDLQGNNMILFPNTDESDGSYGLSSEDEPILLLDSKSTRSTSTIVAPIILKGNDIKQAAAPPEHEISLAICPTAAFRLVRIAWFASVSFSAAFSGTLRLLAPL